MLLTFARTRFILPALLVLSAAAPAAAATTTSKVALGFSDFVLHSSFWEGSTSGPVDTTPPPVTEIRLSFSMTYRSPIDVALRYQGYIIPDISDFSVELDRTAIPNVSDPNDPITGTVFHSAILRWGSGASATYGFAGRLTISSERHGPASWLLWLDFDLPEFFGSDPTGAANAEYYYNPYRSFDSPRYRFAPDHGSVMTVSHEVISVQPGPVPLPAGLWLGLAGLGCLGAVSRCAGRARRPSA